MYTWHGKLLSISPGDEDIERICKNVLNVQHQPKACTSDLDDGSHSTSWLPIWHCVSCKQCTVVYKGLHMATAVFLTEMCVAVTASTGRLCLHSASHVISVKPLTLSVKRTFFVCKYRNAFLTRVVN